MLVREFMTAQVTTLAETDALLDASMLFVRKAYRHIPVVRGKQVVGIITEHDVKQFVPSLLSRITPEEYNQVLENTPVSRAMTHKVFTIGPDQPISEAATLLYEKRIRCLPVVENDELVGVITTTEMLKLLVRLLHDHQPVPR